MRQFSQRMLGVLAIGLGPCGPAVAWCFRACAAAEAEHPVHSRRQHRLRRHRRLRRRGAARGADAAHRPARRRRSAADAVPGRAGLHAVARRVDDRALFHPLRAVAGCGRGDGHLAAGDGNHHGRDAARRRLCHRDLRQMASRRAALQPAAEQGLRRVLRHPAGGDLGRVPDDSPGPADQDARHPARQGAADRRGQARRAAARR